MLLIDRQQTAMRVELVKCTLKILFRYIMSVIVDLRIIFVKHQNNVCKLTVGHFISHYYATAESYY